MGTAMMNVYEVAIGGLFKYLPESPDDLARFLSDSAPSSFPYFKLKY